MRQTEDTRAHDSSFSHCSEVRVAAQLNYAHLSDRMAWILRGMSHWTRQETAAQTLKLMAAFLAMSERPQWN